MNYEYASLSHDPSTRPVRGFASNGARTGIKQKAGNKAQIAAPLQRLAMTEGNKKHTAKSR
jgi:hypothetical protein